MFGKIWNGIKKAGTFVLRRGPIIAAGIVGLGSVPVIGQYAQYMLGILGIFGVQPDPNLSAPAGDFYVQLTLLVGAIRKLWSIFKAFRG